SVLGEAEVAAPDAEILRLGIEAAHQHAADLLGDGSSEEALATAVEAIRLFGVVPVDRKQHPPSVWDLFARAAQHQPSGTTVRVRTPEPGVLFAGPREVDA